MKLSPKFKQFLMIIFLFVWIVFGVHDLLSQRWIPGILKIAIATFFLIIFCDISAFNNQKKG